MKPTDPSPPEMAPDEPGLKPVRFSLATLLLAIAGLCALFAAMSAAGPLGGFALLMVVLVIGMHIAGNAIGTALRDTGGRSLPDDSTYGLPAVRFARPVAAQSPSKLSESFCLGEAPFWGAGLGAGLIGALGAALLAWLNWKHATIANVAFGGAAFAVLGGIGGYAVACFTRVFWTAWGEAVDSLRAARPAAEDPPQ